MCRLTGLCLAAVVPRCSRDVMALLSLVIGRQLPRSVSHFARTLKLFRPPCAGAPVRRLHGSARLRVGEKGPWGKSRPPEQQQYQLTDLDKADAMVGLSPGRSPQKPRSSLSCFRFPPFVTVEMRDLKLLTVLFPVFTDAEEVS